MSAMLLEDSSETIQYIAEDGELRLVPVGERVTYLPKTYAMVCGIIYDVPRETVSHVPTR